MNDISIGAVGAAVIAGLVSLLGLIIGKEQKVSEFRQAWIDDLRKCLISYLVNINAISDSIRMKKNKMDINDSSFIDHYKALNEANHGISLRINSDEDAAKKLLASMLNFEAIAGDNASLTPGKISAAEEDFLAASKELLKFEWNRVKRGEKTFIWAKRIVLALTILMLATMAFLLIARPKAENSSGAKDVFIQNIQSSAATHACPEAEQVKPLSPSPPHSPPPKTHHPAPVCTSKPAAVPNPMP